MSTRPESLLAAIEKLKDAGLAMATQDAAVATPTTGMSPAAVDEISAITAAQFALQGATYQAVSAQAKAMHEMFFGILSAGAAAATQK